MKEESGVKLNLTPTGEIDDWSRPIYTDQTGKTYVDINCGNGQPSIYTVTPSGEPEVPIKNYKFLSAPTKNKFPNALCPRCKNSKPELMKKTPDGKMSCTSCHWQDNADEPYTVGDSFDKFRKELGAERVDEFLAKLGMGPKYKPTKAKTYPCPKCKKKNATYHEDGADCDGGQNEMVLECPDCGHSQS